MTNQEFSNQFDVLYNNVMSNQAPGLDEYEKSVFLTKAQNEIVLSYFNPKGNKYTEGFDGNERRQIDFSMLTRVATETTFSAANYDPRTAGVKSVAMPDDVLVFVNESLTVTRDTKTVYLSVVPISYIEYSRQMSKPFKRPTHYQAWRLINSTDTPAGECDLIAGPNDTITKYTARYIKRPLPIILVPLEGLSIGGYLGRDGSDDLVSVEDSSTATSGIECELDPILHEDILQRAVELAKAAYTGDLSSQVGLGNSSQTNLGVPAYGRGRTASE